MGISHSPVIYVCTLYSVHKLKGRFNAIFIPCFYRSKARIFPYNRILFNVFFLSNCPFFQVSRGRDKKTDLTIQRFSNNRDTVLLNTEIRTILGLNIQYCMYVSIRTFIWLEVKLPFSCLVQFIFWCCGNVTLKFYKFIFPFLSWLP